LDSFGIATRLPERLITRLKVQRDERVEKSFESFKKEYPNELFALACLAFLLGCIVGAGGAVISGAILLYQLIVSGDTWELFLLMLYLVLLCVSSLGAIFLLIHLSGKKFRRAFKPKREEIFQQCEIDISRLSSDPSYLLTQAKLYCVEEKKLIQLELQRLDEEFETNVTDKLTEYRRKLVRWEGNRKKILSESADRLGDKETMLTRAEAAFEKYTAMIQELEPIEEAIKLKRQSVDKELAKFERSIQFIIKVRSEYRSLKSILADIRKEFGDEFNDENQQRKNAEAAEKINSALDEIVGNLHSLQTGIASMAKALPEPDKFCTDAQMQLVA
jgi:hypothetical protein